MAKTQQISVSSVGELERQLELLKMENDSLERKLQICRIWMRRQVEEEVHKIAKRKVSSMTIDVREDFLRENQESIILKQIQEYFGELLLLNAPREMIEYLTNAEINFYNFQKNPNMDGFNVISSYHKILDVLLEHFITNDFRKFAMKKQACVLRTNDPLEKALHLVVTKKYILSAGRLYGMLKSIRNNERLYDYGKVFALYLEKYPALGELLLRSDFFTIFEKIVLSEVFGSKRHQGTISFKETKHIRALATGDFIDKDSLFYLFLSSQAVLY